MSNVWILNQNFLDLDYLAARSHSSEQVNFPAVNAYNGLRRSKVFRSNGYFNIEAGSNDIAFRESTGVDLTATVTVGEYTSDSAFFAAVKSALEAVGDSTYTVARDSTTKKITITSDGLGGGGLFEVDWSGSGLASVMGFTADDSGALTYTADLIRISTGEWLRWDLGMSSNPKAFVLIGPRNNAIQISSTATIKLQGNETDVWTSPSYERVISYDSKSLMKLSSSGLHSSPLRYWRLLVEDLDNLDGYIEIGFVYLGDAFIPERGAISFPLDSEYVDYSTTAYSEGGQPFSSRRQKTQDFNLKWTALTKSDKEQVDEIFDSYGTHTPFFISLDPNAVFGSSAGYHMRFCRFKQPPSFALESPNNFAMSMALREEV